MTTTGGTRVGRQRRFLDTELETLERFTPRLARYLDDAALLDLEAIDNGAIASFKRSSAPTLLLPAAHGGLAASALEAVRYQRAIGSLAPSLAIASTMHHFAATLLTELWRQGDELDGSLLERVATQRLLLAAGFAEGRTGQGLDVSTLKCRRVPDGYLLNGAKKPCSLAQSMDMLVASAIVDGDERGGDPALVLVPADIPGIERQPFWRSSVLAGAESDAVILRNVIVPRDHVHVDPRDEPDRHHRTVGLIWLELLVTAAYIGVASALAARALESRRGAAAERAELAIELETAMSALEGVALAVDDGERGVELLQRALIVRYGAQGAISRAAAGALELLGGIAFITGNEIAYLHSACQALAFHPPSRTAIAGSLADALLGGELAIP